VLAIFPMLSIVAGQGCCILWCSPGSFRKLRRLALAALLFWQCAATINASGDYLAYFNEFAGKDPSKVLVAGCDLDCGQDMFRLSQTLASRHISHVSLALWTSADLRQMGLPNFDVAEPYRPVKGWFAISLRALRFGDVFHRTYPPEGFAWLKQYKPVERVGKTILLYHLPD
jgi:hypothetical protein